MGAVRVEVNAICRTCGGRDIVIILQDEDEEATKDMMIQECRRCRELATFERDPIG